MTCFSQSFIRQVLVLLILLAIHPQENRSGVAEKNFRMLRSSDIDLDTLAASPDDTNQIDPKDKSDEDNKAKHFGYDKYSGPRVWARWFLPCGGRRQSPVNLDTSTAVTQHHPRIMWWNYSLKPRSMTVSNNGHTVLLTAQWARKEDTPYHWSALSSEEYVFQQLHFHWGQDDHSGSEHTLNNERFALEMHVVHYRREISSLKQESRYNVRVIGVFFRVEEFRNLMGQDGKTIKHNWRPTQPLNGRIVIHIR